jgi:catechol 2,3-dioxygenase-like lactoylglutathione lyase family enzyme
MFGAARGSILALLCVAAMGSGMTSALAIETLDTSKLPRLGNGKDVFASEFQTIFTTTDTVVQAGETLTRSLVAQGWKPYIQPFTSNPTYPNMQTMSFKKGTLALSVYISVAPAMGNATSIQYAAIPLANDLPFPQDATDIAYDPSRPHLNFITGQPVQDTLEFFRKELTAQGWSPWSIKDAAKTDSAGTLHSQGGVAYYVRDGKQPMILSLTNMDSKLKGELKSIPNSVLQAISRKDQEPPKVAAAPAPAEMPRNSLADEIERKVLGDVRDQLAGIRKEIEAATSARPGTNRQAQAVQPSNTPAETLHPLPGSMAPIPVPANLDDMEFDGEDGQLEYKSPSSVRTIAAFHRAQMKTLGWRETPSVISRANMAVLDFSKGGKTISITIKQMGPQSNVRATGSGLVTEVGKAETTKHEPETKTAAAPAKVIQQELEAEEVAGLPAPSSSSSKGSEKTPFRLVVNAQVTADVQSVLAFYRRELGKREWKEDAAKAVMKADQASLAYTSPDGPATLKLVRKGDDTIITLSLRKPAAAEKAGVLPKPGQGKVLFGNMLPSEAVVTINKQTVKVGAGVGAKAPDGPTLDLPPGKYKFSFKIGGAPAQTDEVEISADETWGILIGPGGALALHAY